MVRTIVRNALAVLAAATLAACGESTLPGMLRLDITADRASYAAGSSATLTVRNLGDETVTYSLCSYQVQQQTATGWGTAHAASLPCIASILTLAPGESATGTVTLPASLAAGTYRVFYPEIAAAWIDASSVDLATRKSSKPFEVTR